MSNDSSDCDECISTVAQLFNEQHFGNQHNHSCVFLSALSSPTHQVAHPSGSSSHPGTDQKHRCSRELSLCTLTRQTVSRVTNQIRHITTAKSSHSFGGLIWSRNKKTYVTRRRVNQLYLFYKLYFCHMSPLLPPRVRMEGGLSAHTGSRAECPLCCPAPDWMKEAGESMRPASAVCCVSDSSGCHPHSLWAVGILMNSTFYQINRRGWKWMLSPFSLYVWISTVVCMNSLTFNYSLSLCLSF